MASGALPWEAGSAVLDLVRFRRERGLEPPTIRVARWVYRLRLAASDIPTELADQLAAWLALAECGAKAKKSDIRVKDPEPLLTCRPWRGEAEAKADTDAGFAPYPMIASTASFGDPQMISEIMGAKGFGDVPGWPPFSKR